MQNVLRLLYWELTGRCNLRCRHCRAGLAEGTAGGELDTDQLLQIAQDIREDADPFVVLSGGEPLVRPDFFEIAETCTRLFSHVALATNGTLIDDGIARRILECGIERVSINLDGARGQTHDEFRGVKGSYGAALRGFAMLKGAGASLQINMTVTRQNADEIGKLLELALECGADAFHLFLLVPVGCGAALPADASLDPEKCEELLQWFFLRSVELQGRIELNATCAPQYVRIARELSSQYGITAPEDSEVSHGCLAGTEACFISHTGDVQPCGYLSLSAGSVREQKLGEIWRESTLFAALRDPERLTGKCGDCQYRQACQGCRARAYALTGDYLASEPGCSYQPSPRLTGVGKEGSA